jgi:hypothetical protein
VKVASEPEALLAVLKNPAYRFKRIGLEAGPLSQWRHTSEDSLSDPNDGLGQQRAAITSAQFIQCRPGAGRHGFGLN